MSVLIVVGTVIKKKKKKIPQEGYLWCNSGRDEEITVCFTALINGLIIVCWVA